MAKGKNPTIEKRKKPLVFDISPSAMKGSVLRFRNKSEKNCDEKIIEPEDKKIVQSKAGAHGEFLRTIPLLFYVIGLVASVFVLRQAFSAFDQKTAHVEFFANTVRAEERGGWSGVDRVLGEAEVAPVGGRDDFNSENSAIYEGGDYSLIAENFTTREFIRTEVAQQEGEQDDFASTSESALKEIFTEDIKASSTEFSTGTSTKESIISTSSPESVVIISSSSDDSIDTSAIEPIVSSEGMGEVQQLDQNLDSSSSDVQAEEDATPVTEDQVIEEVGNHLPINEDIEPVADISSSSSEPVVDGPVSKTDAFLKELAKVFLPAPAMAQDLLETDDRDETFGRFRSARIKISLASFNKAWDNAEQDASAITGESEIIETTEQQVDQTDQPEIDDTSTSAGNVDVEGESSVEDVSVNDATSAGDVGSDSVVSNDFNGEQGSSDTVTNEVTIDTNTVVESETIDSPSSAEEVVQPSEQAPEPAQESAPSTESESPISKLFNIIGLREAKAQEEQREDKIVVWYSLSTSTEDQSWEELYSIPAGDLSNAEDGGYLLLPAPFLKKWKDIDNLKIKFQGKTPLGENYFFYLDAVWVEADYDQVKAPPIERVSTSSDKDFLDIDGQRIYLENTDDNVDENLIIRTNKKSYFGLSNADVYFSVENVGVRDEEINLQFYFPSATSGVASLKKLIKNSPYITEVPYYEPAVFECDNGWDARDDHYECYPTGESRVCDQVSPNRRYCRIEEYRSGVRQEVRYKHRWAEVPLSNFPISTDKGFLDKILALGPQTKDVPDELEVDRSTLDSVDLIAPGEVRYYKASIYFSPNSEGEFYIEAVGDKDGYGLLDPWWNSGWNFRMPITVDNRSGSQTLTDQQVYIQVSSTTADLWRNIRTDGGDIRFLDYSETSELDFWTQTFDRTASSAKFWVKVPSVPAASTTKIYLYYGNSSATTTSDQYAPFTYSSVQGVYFVNSAATSTSIEVVSLIDGNSVQVDGGSSVNLDRQGKTFFTTYTASSTISAKGPIAVKVSGGPATPPAAPISFAATDFTLPFDRDLEIFNFLPVLSDATVTLYDGASQEWQQSIVSGHSRTVINSIATDSLAIISVTAPVLVSLTTNFPGDGIVAYPPTGEDLFGVKSQYNIIAAHSLSSFDILCSSRASSSVSNMAAGSRQNNTTCSGGVEGNGNAVRLDIKSGSLSSIQQDDSDGRQETMFLPFREFNSEYMLPTDAAYVDVVCSPETGTLVINVYDQDNYFVASSTCTPQSGRYPGMVRFGADDALSYQAGSRIFSSSGKPFGVYYEDIEATGYAGGDETNLWGAVQARKYAYPAPLLSFGAHEIKGPPTGSFNSASLKVNGTGRVDVSIEIDDSTNDDCRAKLEYYADANCHGSPLRPTLSETDASTTADFGDPKINIKDTYQIGTSTGWIKTASGTNTVLLSWDSKADIPNADATYCLKLTANDQLNDQTVPATTSLAIDNVAPTMPGPLTLSRKTGSTASLDLGATSTENHFSEYKIFYKVYDGNPVTENDYAWGSSSDANLSNIEFNGAATTTVTGLTSGLIYVFNIFAYDDNGNKASSTSPLQVIANDAPIAYFNSVTQETDGSGSVNVSIEVDDANDDNTVRAKLEYSVYPGSGHCDFSSPSKNTIDLTSIVSSFGSVQADNNESYQIGTTSFFILTSAGPNTVSFSWLSKDDVGLATGTYCLRLTANDGSDDQLIPATTTISIDNAPPQAAGNMAIIDTAYDSILLSLPYSQRAVDDSEPGSNAYKIFYKLGTSGVTKANDEHDSVYLDAYDFGGATSTMVTGLVQGSNYVFNLWAYDAYGNKTSSTEVTGSTDGIVTNKGLVFMDPQSLGTSTNIAVADGIFTFRAQVQDSDGWGALDYVILRMANSSDNSAPFDDLQFKWDRAGDDFSEVGTDANSMASVDGSSYSDCSDGTCYLYFKLIFSKNFVATSTDYSAQLYSSDTDIPVHTDEDTYPDIFQVRKTWLDQIHYRWRNDDGGG